MRHLADDIVWSVKDAMRQLRHVIRAQAQRDRATPAGDMGAGRRTAASGRRRGRMAGLVDQVFTEMESGALALVSPGRGGEEAAPLHPVLAYFARGAADEAGAAGHESGIPSRILAMAASPAWTTVRSFGMFARASATRATRSRPAAP